jgi:DHA1 family bicyclomycin/chloramphenicol resistance-like MFS transporter
MEVFHVNAKQFSAIFAGLAVGFIGSNQVNILLLRKFSSEQIFRWAMIGVCPLGTWLLVGTIAGWFGLWATLARLFVTLSALGLCAPNGSALALVPFDHNIGSASAMLGFLQLGAAGLASACVGIFDSPTLMPAALVLAVTSWIGLGILLVGKKRIPQLRFVEEKAAHQLPP